MIGSAVLAGGATLVGKTIVSNLLKFIPVYGTVAGGVLNATVASTLTEAIGRAWIVCLTKWADDPEELANLSRDQIGSDFLKQFRGREAA